MRREIARRPQHEKDRQRIGGKPRCGARVVIEIRRHPHVDRDLDGHVEHDEGRESERIRVAHHPQCAGERGRRGGRRQSAWIARCRRRDDEQHANPGRHHVQILPRQPRGEQRRHDGGPDDRAYGEESLHRVHERRVLARRAREIADQRERPDLEDADADTGRRRAARRTLRSGSPNANSSELAA